MNCGFIQLTSNISKHSSSNCTYDILTKMQQSDSESEKECGTDNVVTVQVDGTKIFFGNPGQPVRKHVKLAIQAELGN